MEIIDGQSGKGAKAFSEKSGHGQFQFLLSHYYASQLADLEQNDAGRAGRNPGDRLLSPLYIGHEETERTGT